MSMKRHTTEHNMTTVEDGHNTADDGETHNENRREIQMQQHSNLINLLKQKTFCRSVSRVDTKNNTADHFTKHLDGLRTRARRNWDYAFWIWLMVVRTRKTDDDN